jgi:FlaA1/EpsC-like NDP-sugar epimerase
VSVRLLVDTLKFGQPDKQRMRTIIYGAGSAGIALLREIRHNPALAYDVCGFVDDSEEKRGLSIHGVQVLGGGPDLRKLGSRHALELVLIAIPSASGHQMTSILGHCHEARLSNKTMPSLAELIEENGLARQMRDVAVEDLLGRSPVRMEQDRISAKLQNRTVLVTGAAGSIGSELCRQIARFRPAAIVAYDIAETPLFLLEREMARTFSDVPFRPEIGSIQNTRRLSEVFGEHNPSMVYHAAAYKHVPLMESHAFEAVENNVSGTLNVAMAAAKHEVTDFVMISSDKAVHPTNLMGATKRLAELIIRSLQGGGVKHVSVRFGNVLGSNGSVVPIFKDQIARGGPVTVTHPAMRRYFMTIPEASQLVLQSSTMGRGGEIFVLDMGEPVRILDLARNLILLSGFRPDHDIKIQFTGARPGEKLYEEMNTLEEDTLPTYHDRIKVFSGTNVAWPVMADHLARLQEICAGRDLNELLLILKDIVPEYNPSAELLRRVLRKPTAPVYLSLAG